MAQAKITIPASAICIGCNKPKNDHGVVYKATCDRFRQTDCVSVMDTCNVVVTDPREV
jgi:hypothetical protein